jgi:hypothetical protein
MSYFEMFCIFWIICSIRPISSSVSLVSSPDCVFLSSISSFASAVTPVFTFTHSLPATVGTVHESNAPVNSSIADDGTTTPVSSIPVLSIHVITAPVESSDSVGA